MARPDYIDYTITKTGENSYTMTWTPVVSQYVNVQKNIVHLESEDADGTKTVQNIELPPTAIATWNTSNVNQANLGILNSGGAVDGFKLVNTDNLAVSGVCYEVEDVVS